jgi:predicted transcriptional regulator
MNESNTKGVGKEDGYGHVVRQLGRKQRIVLDKLQNEDYLNSIAKDMRMSFNGIKYHAEELADLGLIQKTGRAQGRQFWKTTQKGEIILDMVNVPNE